MSKLLQEVQHFDKYSRYRYDLTPNRREEWEDTVKRVTDYLFSFDRKNQLTQREKQEVYETILNKEVMPSMRNLAMAGEAAARQNACSYNCSAMPIEDLFFFYEAVIILMSGSGLGYSVEKRFTEKLPIVSPQQGFTPSVLVVEDTTEGWADAVLAGIVNWFAGLDVVFDFSMVRPAGSILRVKGGRASGHEVLETSLNKIRDIVLSNQGKKLSPLCLHDITCHIAKCIVSGGVRRSAMICLFDYGDKEMATCKDRENIDGNEQRYLSNNSAVFETHLTKEEIESFMNIMFDSNAGEPGIFSRYAIRKTLPDTRQYDENFLTNPCAEIILKPYQFCNLSSVVCRVEDTLETLLHKVRIATIIGTLQSMSQYFPNLRGEWEKNQVEERLLGVDLNGIMDCPLVQNKAILQILREHAREVNNEYSTRLNINPSAAITCVKPSGNASVLLDTSAGIHNRFAQYYTRRIQLDVNNPVLKTLQLSGVPTEPSNFLANTWVASFPVKSPNVVVEKTALEQLETWKLVKLNWTEHNPSCTISYTEKEKGDVIEWVYQNQDIISGLSFLPRMNTIYEQMPYEEITEEQYNNLLQSMPKNIDWGILHILEKGDQTNASQTSGCDGEKCSISF